MESFRHKMIISSQPVPLTGTGVLYPRVRDFFSLLLIFLFSTDLFRKEIRTRRVTGGFSWRQLSVSSEDEVPQLRPAMIEEVEEDKREGRKQRPRQDLID